MLGANSNMSGQSLAETAGAGADGVVEFPGKLGTGRPLHQSVVEMPAPPGAKAARSEWKEKLALAAIPALITLAAGVGIAVYTNHSSRQQMGFTENQKLGETVLNKTSDIEVKLRKARKLLVNGGFDAAATARLQYRAALDGWYSSRATLVYKSEASFGQPFALLLDAPANMNLVVDRCGVAVNRDDPHRGQNCAVRLDREVEVLTAKQDAANHLKDIPLDHTRVAPVDFTSSLRLANSLFERVVDCKKPAGGADGKPQPAPADRCIDLKNLQYALNLRVNLLGMSQAAIAQALTH